MRVCQLSQDCLRTLYNNWTEYYNQRLKIIEYIRDKKMAEWEAEAKSDIRAGRYSTSSVQDWYDSNVRKMRNWVNECVDSLKETDAKFERFYKRVCNDYFSANDYGTTIIYDFYRFEVRRERYDSYDHFNVRFTGQTHWYSWDPIPKTTAEFETGKPYFSSWFDY